MKKLYIFLKNKGIELCFWAIFSIFIFVNLVLAINYMRLEISKSYNNSPFNSQAITFLIESDCKDKIDISFISGENKWENYVVFKYDDENQSEYEVVFCGRNVVSFEEKINWNWDFNSGENIAVVGYCSEYNIGDCFVKDGINYIVKGRLKKHISEAINYGIFYSKCQIDSIDAQGCYIISSKKSKKIKYGFSDLQDKLKKDNINLKIIEIRNAEFDDYIKIKNETLIIFLLVSVFYGLLLFVSKWIWNKYKEPELFVLNILGCKHSKLKINIQYIMIWLFSILTNLLVVWGRYCCCARLSVTYN